jgi:hypothetical protein
MRKAPPSAALAGTDDLDAIAGAKRRVSPCRTRHDLSIDGNGNTSLSDVDGLFFEQGGKRGGSDDLVLAVEANTSNSSGLRHK